MCVDVEGVLEAASTLVGARGGCGGEKQWMKWERWVGQGCEDPDAGSRPSIVRGNLYSYVFIYF